MYFINFTCNVNERVNTGKVLIVMLEISSGDVIIFCHNLSFRTTEWSKLLEKDTEVQKYLSSESERQKEEQEHEKEETYEYFLSSSISTLRVSSPS